MEASDEVLVRFQGSRHCVAVTNRGGRGFGVHVRKVLLTVNHLDVLSRHGAG